MHLLRRGLNAFGVGAGSELGVGTVVVHQIRVPALNDRHQLLTGDGLLLEQVTGNLIHQLPVVPDDGLGLLKAAVQNVLDLFVHQSGGLRSTVETITAVQILAANGGKAHNAEVVTHAEHGDHFSGQIGGALNVVGGSGGGGVEDDIFRSPAAQQGAELGIDLFLVVEELFLLWGLHGVAQRTLGVGHDGDFGHRLGALLLGGHQSVTHLVISHQPLFLFGQHRALFLGAGDDHFKGHQQVVLVHRLAAHADRTQRGLVDQIGQICAHSAGGGLGDLVQVHVAVQPDLASVHLQRGQSARQVGPVHGDPPVEAPGTQQRLVQHLRTVGGAQNDDALGGIEAVQLCQQLVQRLLPLVVAAHAVVAALADGVDFVDEDDAGSHFTGFLEQVADTAGAHADEHLHEVGAGNGEERDLCLAGDGFGQQRFAGAGGAHQQRALGQLSADGGVFLGVMEEVDDLLQGFLGLVLTSHVTEGDAGLLFHVDFGVGLAHVANAAAHAAAEHSEHQHHAAHHDGHGQYVGEQELGHGAVLLVGGVVSHTVLLQHQRKVGVADGGCVQVGHIGLSRVHAGVFGVVLRQPFLLIGLFQHKGIAVVLELDLFHLVLFYQLDEIAEFHLYAAVEGHGGKQPVEARQQNQRPHDDVDDAHDPAVVIAGFFVRRIVVFQAETFFLNTRQPLSGINYRVFGTNMRCTLVLYHIII